MRSSILSRRLAGFAGVILLLLIVGYATGHFKWAVQASIFSVVFWVFALAIKKVIFFGEE
ncbi:hypothetical protein WG915_00305 [Corynebacterium sp. H128]|uniref:hypothetical protein n=1 Tax=Corynebacterium sp. H128 TaxID=3133427 RepID=UPI0030A8E30A